MISCWATATGVLYQGVANTRITQIASDQGQAFVFEERYVPCSPSPCFGGKYTDWLLRILIYSGVFTRLLRRHARRDLHARPGRLHAAAYRRHAQRWHLPVLAGRPIR